LHEWDGILRELARHRIPTRHAILLAPRALLCSYSLVGGVDSIAQLRDELGFSNAAATTGMEELSLLIMSDDPS
jgi:hypothetical protein